MSVGNQLYSSLSQLGRQSYLMLSELPTMLNAFDAITINCTTVKAKLVLCIKKLQYRAINIVHLSKELLDH